MIRWALFRLLKRRAYIHQPSFIFSLSYFLRWHEPTIALHRTLFFLSCNTPWRFFIELVSYLRWISYCIWRKSYKGCKATTNEQLQRLNLTRFALFREFVKFGILYSLKPAQYIEHQLYKKENQRVLFHFVYDHQSKHFHNYVNVHFLGSQTDRALIANKHAFSCALKKINIPTVSSMYYDTWTLIQCPHLLFHEKTIFCKPNGSSRSHDCFLLSYEKENNSYQLEPIHGELICDFRKIEHYLKQAFSRHAHFLIQPFIQAHESLKIFSSNNATPVVRIITGKMTLTSKPILLYLQFEIPKIKINRGKKEKQQYYKILPLHWESLDIDPIFKEKYPWIQEDYPPISDILKDMLRTSITYCIEAHYRLLNLRSVAFDVILSPDGPMLLEANFNWAITLLYPVIALDPLAMDNPHPAAHWLKSLFYLKDDSCVRQ